jgi:hypothetical protein
MDDVEVVNLRGVNFNGQTGCLKRLAQRIDSQIQSADPLIGGRNEECQAKRFVERD